MKISNKEKIRRNKISKAAKKRWDEYHKIHPIKYRTKIGTKEHSLRLSIAIKRGWKNISKEQRKKISLTRSKQLKKFYSTKRGRKQSKQNGKKHSMFMLNLWKSKKFYKKMLKVRRKQFTPEVRAKIAKWRSTQKFPYNHTKPENRIKDVLLSLGLNFKSQFRPKFCKYHAFDFKIRGYKVLIEVDGCYWHGCRKHCKKECDKQITRDATYTKLVKVNGWQLIRIWEHDTKNYDKLFNKILGVL